MSTDVVFPFPPTACATDEETCSVLAMMHAASVDISNTTLSTSHVTELFADILLFSAEVMRHDGHGGQV